MRRAIAAAIFLRATIGAALGGPLLDGGAAAPPPASVAGIESVKRIATAPSSPDGGFLAREAALRHAAEISVGADRRRAAEEFAAFYEANRLHVEALAALGEAQGAKAMLLGARCQYGLGRFAGALATLEADELAGDREARALRALAQARLGAFASAHRAFGGAAPAELSEALRDEFYLLKAESAVGRGDAPGALAALQRAGRAGAESDFIRARAQLLAGDKARGRGALRLLASGEGQIAARAALALAVEDFVAGRTPARETLAKIGAARLSWSGGALEREALAATARVAEEFAPDEAFAAARALVDKHPAADAAAAARRQLSAMLTTLFARQDLAPQDAARLFYENLDFAPPGAAGDALIRDVAERLVALDLLDPAAELLEHQTFKRLRGTERARVAAGLAQLHLERREPREALRVIRATRIAGLDAATANERLLLEARALELTGADDAALELLKRAAGPEAALLTAEIFWRAQSWLDAARAYGAIFSAAAAPQDEAMRQISLRAAAAYLKAGADDELAAFAAKAAQRLAAFPEARLLAALASDADGEAFFAAYRALFNDTERAGDTEHGA